MERLEDADDAAEAEAQRHANRFLRLYPDHDGSWVVRGRLDPEVGAVLEKALEWAREALYQQTRRAGEEGTEKASVQTETPVELETSPGQRLADALGLVAERALAADADDPPSLPVSRAERFQVVLHTSGDASGTSREEPESEADPALAHSSAISRVTRKTRVSAGTPLRPLCSGETSRLGTGPRPGLPHLGLDARAPMVPREAMERMACDSDLVEMRHTAGGSAPEVARKRRTVPPALRRALDYRDWGCRFPGCACRYTDAHHITHWAKGGETTLDNLILLCRRHHRAVHEDGFRIEVAETVVPGREAGGDLGLDFRFFRPDGRPFPAVPSPPPVPPDPMDELIRQHREMGVEPGPWTATPDWHGETLELGLAIDMLRGLREDGGRTPGPLT